MEGATREPRLIHQWWCNNATPCACLDSFKERYHIPGGTRRYFEEALQEKKTEIEEAQRLLASLHEEGSKFGFQGETDAAKLKRWRLKLIEILGFARDGLQTFVVNDLELLIDELPH
jgi:hypothetical protein